jgi:hypothetical protein
MVVLQHIPDNRSRRIRPKISIIGEGVVDRLRSHTLRGRGSFCDEFESEKLTKLGNVVFFCDIVMIHSIIQDVVQRWSFLFFSQGDDHMFSVVGFFGHFDVASQLMNKRVTEFFENPDNIRTANNRKLWQRNAPGVLSVSVL